MDMQDDRMTPEEGEKEDWEGRKWNKSKPCPTGTAQLRGPSRRARDSLTACPAGQV